MQSGTRQPLVLLVPVAVALSVPACSFNSVPGWCHTTRSCTPEQFPARSQHGFHCWGGPRPEVRLGQRYLTKSIFLWATKNQRSYREPTPYDDDEDAFDPGRQRRPRGSDDGFCYYDDDDLEGDYQGDESGAADEDYLSTPTPIEWEEVQVPDLDQRGSTTAHVLLPPAPPSANPLPSAVLHFVGGTFFGSVPRAFYRALLEDIVLHTQCAIVVTPLPIITPLTAVLRGREGGMTSSPLDHVQMAKSLRHQFQYAFERVLEDEYGVDAMATVPIAGLGHSLGARILVVLATLMEPPSAEQPPTPRRGRGRDDPEPTYRYKSMILIAFTNFGASESIPGIQTLLQQRRQLEDNLLQRQRQRRREDRQREAEKPPPSTKDQERRPDRRRRKRDFWDRDENDEEEEDEDGDWGKIWSDLQEIFQEQTDRFKTQLTPQAEDLEFYPSPRQLWSILQGNEERKPQYSIPQTLLIQFNRDVVDQSSKLATILTCPKTPPPPPVGDGAPTATDAIPTALTDLKFARLRGKHLIPVSLGSSSSSQLRDEGLLQEWSSKTLQAIGEQLQEYFEGGKVPPGNVPREEARLELRQTITRYITDVVTK